MELFAYKVKFDSDNDPIPVTQDGTYPDSTFNTFIEALYSVFIVLANDGWSTIYFDHYRAVGGASSTIFFLTLLSFG
jgi:hypothetical protein